jgi:hypothetical protein
MDNRLLGYSNKIFPYLYHHIPLKKADTFIEVILMNHEKDFDRDRDREDALTENALKEVLEAAYTAESELMRRYLITSERVHNDHELKERLANFAEGNAKRTKQLQNEISKLH